MANDVLKIPVIFKSYKSMVDGSEDITFNVDNLQVIDGSLDELRKNKDQMFTLILAKME